MKLPFFSSPKAEPKPATNTTVTPPGVATRTIQPDFNQSAPAPRNAPVHPAEMSETRPLFRRPQPVAGGPTIDIPITAFLSQLPAQLFTPNAHSQLTLISVAIPQDRVLPQLKTGKITVMLEELIPLFPAHLVRQPVSSSVGQQAISLPLGDVVAAVPSSVFNVEHESTLDLNSPEFNSLPPLFDEGPVHEPSDSTAEQPAVQPEPEPVAEIPDAPFGVAEPAPTQTAQPVAPVVTATPAPIATAKPASVPQPTKPVVAKPQLVSKSAAAPVTAGAHDFPAQVMFTLRGLAAGMPDKVFSVSRADLWHNVDPESRVALPFEAIQSQLQSARVRLPIETVIDAMPPSLFVSPLPQFSGETVPLPLNELIPQLPERVFTTLFHQPQTEALNISDTIPTPFHERNETSTDVQPIAAQAVEPVTTPSVTTVTPAAPELVKEVTSAAQLEDESFTIFAEKTPPPPAIPEDTIPTYVIDELEPVAAAPQPEPEPEPVAEATPAIEPEPVAEQIVEDVDAEELAPLAAAVPEPHVEEVPARTPESAAADDRKFLVNLNRCSAEELVRIQGIGPALARRIVAAREERGQFKSLRELRRVPGIGPKTYRALVGTEPRVLNRLLGVEHDQELSLQDVVKHISTMEGVAGAILAMSDGLLLTGQLPENLDSNAMSVFAPQLFKKVGRYTREIRVGQIRRLTIFTDQQPVSIFQAGDIYLVIVHDPRRYSKALLRRCERIGQEIAALCRQRAVVRGV